MRVRGKLSDFLATICFYRSRCLCLSLLSIERDFFEKKILHAVLLQVRGVTNSYRPGL